MEKLQYLAAVVSRRPLHVWRVQLPLNFPACMHAATARYGQYLLSKWQRYSAPRSETL